MDVIETILIMKGYYNVMSAYGKLYKIIIFEENCIVYYYA